MSTKYNKSSRIGASKKNGCKINFQRERGFVLLNFICFFVSTGDLVIGFHLIAGRRAALAAVLVAATQAPALTAAAPGNCW